MPPHLDVYLTAFFDLDTERSLADLQPIPWSSIVAYADRYGFTEESLAYYVREADNAYLKQLHKKRKRA